MGVDYYTCDCCGEIIINDNNGNRVCCESCGSMFCCKDCADDSDYKLDEANLEDSCDYCNVMPKVQLLNPLYMVLSKTGKLVKTGKGMGTVGTYDTIGSAKRLVARRGGKVIKVTEYELVE